MRINGLHEIASRFDGMLIDQFGVIHDGQKLYPGTARVLAERLLAAAADDDTRLRHAFLATLSRPPAAAETAVLYRALARERVRYARDEPAARALLAAGESPRDERIPAPEHAAWTQVASLVLNLSETVMRN